MIKARAGALAIIGLSRMNLNKLQEGKPIIFVGAEIGLPGDICIMFGETEQDILDEINVASRRPNESSH